VTLERLIRTVIICLLLVSCEQEKFKSTGGQNGRNGIGLTCQDATVPETVRGDYGQRVQIEGQLCPVNNNDPGLGSAAQIIFAVDFSGSMLKADEMKNNTCGRLAAANTVLNAYMADVDLQFTVSLIQFHDQAEVAVTKIPRNQAMSILKPENFCEFREPEHKVGNTNYEAALQSMSSLMTGSSVSHAKIYFLTDGLPSVSSNVPIEKTIEEMDEEGIDTDKIAIEDTKAAHRKMDEYAGWEMFAIYLKWDISNIDPEIEPFELLSKLTGSPAKVGEVTEANQLATKIQDFVPPPQDKPITPQDILVEVRANGYPAKNFQVDASSFKWTGGKLDPVSFKTLPIELHGKPGTVTENTLVISARDLRFRPVTARIVWDLRDWTADQLNQKRNQQQQQNFR